MTKARDIANAGTALSSVDATELGYVNGVTSAIQTQLDAKTAKSTLTTTGDIYYASSANTPARLGIGSTGNVLTVSGGVPTWAAPASSGGYTLLSTTTLSGSSTSISITPTGYKALMISIEGADLSATDGFYININNDNKTNLALVRYDSSAASVSGSKNGYINFNNGTDMSGTTHMAAGILWIYNPTSTTVSKVLDYRVSWLDGTGGTNWASYIAGGAYTGSSISSINFDQFGSSTFDGGSVLVYGVN